MGHIEREIDKIRWVPNGLFLTFIAPKEAVHLVGVIWIGRWAGERIYVVAAIVPSLLIALFRVSP